MGYGESLNKALNPGSSININGQIFQVPEGGQWYRPPELVKASDELARQGERDLAMGEQAYYERGAKEGDPFAQKALSMLNKHLSR